MKTKSFFPRLKKQLAFTMIELLIVIAILGILAVAVLSAINPIEQINRGRDTGSRSDAEQLLSAIERFYAMTGYYPWNTAVGDDPSQPWTEVNTAWVVDDTPFDNCPVLNRLSEVTSGLNTACNDEPGTQELKLSFVTKMDDGRNSRLNVYHNDSTYTSTYVCFAPQSNAMQQEAGERALTELPDDYPSDHAIGNTDLARDGGCGDKGNCICLP